MYSIVIVLQINNGLIDSVAHTEHVQVIRCDIKPGSVERSKHVEIRISRGSILRNRFKLRHTFFNTLFEIIDDISEE
jgi:hypothetical protein